jgi:DNA-binding IscR family transcriptional regulator
MLDQAVRTLKPTSPEEVQAIVAEAGAAARAVLAKATINDVVERENRAAGASMYYI